MLVKDKMIESVKASKVIVEDIDGLFLSPDKNVEIILKELFTLANNAIISTSNGKALVASAIVSKGVSADVSDTFLMLANKIKSIMTAQVTIQNTSLNVIAPYTKNIKLTHITPIEELCTTVLEYIHTTGVVKYNCDFNNADYTSFIPNYNIAFNGVMKLKPQLFYPSVITNRITEESNFIFIDDFKHITDLLFVTGGLTVTALPIHQIVIANADINLTGIESIDNVTWISNCTGASRILLLMSFNSGLEWMAFDGLEWGIVDIDNIEDVNTNGMTPEIVATLDKSIIEYARNGSTELRFAYYLDQATDEDVLNNDRIAISITMPGYSQICDKSKYELTYDVIANTIIYDFNTDGTYTINYDDEVIL